MTTSAASVASTTPADQPQGFVVRIVGAAAFAHLLNDLIQAVLPSIYPMLKSDFALSFAQIGWIALVYQVTASLLQPWVGLFTDKYPQPFLLPAGMLVTLVGIALLAFAGSYEMLLLAAAVVGVGSATFHPEASRVARMASGGRFGTAQSTFQVGGNTGSALGPLLTAAIVIPHGQPAIAWFMLAAALAVWVLLRVTGWSVRHGQARLKTFAGQQAPGLSRGAMWRAVVVVAVLMFAKFVYIASFTNYFTFYLIEHFGLSVQHSQLYLFVFLAAVALGTFAGGPVGDRIGRKAVIWVSFLGVAPFALALPHANLAWTAVLAVAIGLVMSSAFAALVVYAQEAVPGRVGMVSGVMFGLMFGISGIGAAGLGELADRHGIEWVYQAIAFLPLLGLATALLPATRSQARPNRCC
ncbi:MULTISPECIES: MFS transporter [unclassified Pseudomonas]|uniref:MFS transporter n=1 Tax=unclassified Pseudomonas TaxID=196821 RepID=UPI000B69C7DE|nr:MULTISPECIES: MFS transporter [Pseudomonas]SNT43251.1 MFS transporter, FSR family, fosmidomycin resistance protein [Pseudomonas sp. LAMO17WK12:I8]SNY36402.1 MFS transporter, FSR family, fosmidomycin resistance protein [Pseudomonas sp. LAMO17WK12:I11]SNY36455.1 MFS transporter, FSR family, fosmidomycin resistance protein [Pseudomonas sp. LAMO17WK12:I12]SNY37389.1 MFS transporter, FSR family, fosmidomycin resistance protein [Pseudomonas sp. LAMO17WK12:I7]